MGSNNNSPMANNNSDNWDSPTISRSFSLIDIFLGPTSKPHFILFYQLDVRSLL